MYKPITKIGLNTKLLPKWHGLFRVKDMTTPHNALLQWVHNGKMLKTSVCMDRLKPGTSWWQRPTRGLKLAELSESDLSVEELICSDNESNTPLRKRRRNAPPSDYIPSSTAGKSSEGVWDGRGQDFKVARKPNLPLVHDGCEIGISDPEAIARGVNMGGGGADYKPSNIPIKVPRVACPAPVPMPAPAPAPHLLTDRCMRQPLCQFNPCWKRQIQWLSLESHQWTRLMR